MTKPDLDRIEKQIDLKAPRERVWRAIASAKEFGTWFGLGAGLELQGDFAPGAKVAGIWRVGDRDVREHFFTIEVLEPERLLVFRWVPYEVPEGEDHTQHPTTRIEMRLEDIAGGTRLTVSESGFAALPADKQYKRQQNGDGWAVQVHAIAQHVLGRITVEVEDHVARPVADVFEAIVSRGSARLVSGTEVTWEWSDAAATLPIQVREVVENKKVSFLWTATGTPTVVTLSLEPDGERTKITAEELPFELSEESAARAVAQTRGWTDFCCCLKAYLQHGINLRAGKPADDVA